MADQRKITLYQGHGTPRTIVLRALPVADVSTGATIRLKALHATARTIILGALPGDADVAGGPVAGSASQALGILTQSVTGRLLINGQAAQSLAALTQSASGKVRIAGTAAQSLGAVTQSAAGALRIAGTASQTLGTVTQAASAAVRIAGAASQTLAAVTQAATGITGTAQEELFTGLGPGWGNYRLEWRDRKWVKRKEREDELASLIRQVYAELSGETPAEVIKDAEAAPVEKAAAKAVQTLAPFKDGSGINWEALAANAAAIARVEDALEAYLQARDEEDEVLLLVAA